MIAAPHTVQPGDWLLAGIALVLIVVSVVDAVHARRRRAASPEALLEAARTELLGAQVSDLSQRRGDLLLVNVRRPYDTTATPMLIDSARLSAATLDAVHRTRAPVLLRRPRKTAGSAA